VSTAASWAASWSAVAVLAVCAVIAHRMGTHGSRLPGFLHPVLSRLLILGMFVGGCAVALTALGGYIIAVELWATDLAHGNAAGFGRDLAVGAGVFLFLTVLIALVWVPDPRLAWCALALPFVAALSGGHLHGILTVLPVVQWCEEISHWVGG
jgi:hypothetical protein